MSGAVEHLYRYEAASRLGEGVLSLATSGGASANPYFFEGELTKPRLSALALRALSVVVGTRFYVPPAMVGKLIALSDPVVTSSRGMLRFEGFSGCASAYVRLDLTEAGFRGETNAFGTTNVDFNAGMRAALASVRDGAPLALSVGKHELALRTTDRHVVERKVPLPVRWLKGFVEVQAYLSRMTLFHEIARTDAMRFLRGLPRAKTHKHDVYLVPQGATVRASMTAAPGALRTTALERLRVLEELAAHAQALRIYGEPNGQASAWELDFGALRLTLALSAEVWRGFSGEGQSLVALAKKDTIASLLPAVRAQLRWQALLDPAALAESIGADADMIDLALQVLGARGLVGFDQRSRAFFHRELPFDMDKVEDLAPRLESARELVNAGAVQALPEAAAWRVKSADVTHSVHLDADDPDAAAARCSCPWFAKHGQSRGPCKHVLAVLLTLDAFEQRGTP